MQAIILCAGFGTRLKPLTDSIPKAMVPIAGKPLLERNIEQYKKFGITEFLINLHYLPDAIKDYFGDGSRWGVKITYKYENPILGTAGAIKNFEKELGDVFFLSYGDVLSFADYGSLLKAFLEEPDAIGIETVGETTHPHDSDLAEVDGNLKFIKIYRKPHENIPEKYKSMRGLYVFKKEITNYIPAGEYHEIDHELLPEILSKGISFYGHETGGYIKDIGTPERYKKAQEDFEKLTRV